MLPPLPVFDVGDAFERISKGDPEARDLLWVVYRFVHKQDDLIDKDKPVATSESVRVDLEVMRAFSKNAFFQKHQDFLWPLLVTSGLAFVASEELARRDDVLEKIASQVLKSQYVDVFFGVAFCIGGWDHALAMSNAYRCYHFDRV